MSDKAEFTVKLTDKVRGPAKSATRGVRELDSSLHKVARTAKESGGFLGGAMDVFKGNLITAAVGKVAELGGAIVHASSEMIRFGQNSRFAFDNLAKHGAEPEKLFEHSRALAKRFGLDIIDTTDAYKQFLKLQFDPHQADNMIRMGADLRALGADAEEVKGVFLALGQIKGKGRLQGEEMLQLAERGVSTVLVQEEIGKLMGGKDTKEVQKLMQKGKVDAETGLLAIENAIKRKLGESSLGEAGAKFADTTIDGITGKFKAWAQDTGLRLLDKVAAPITEKLGAAFSSSMSWLSSPEGAAMIERIADGIGRAAELAGAFADEFSGNFGETWRAMSEGAQPFFDLIGGGGGVETVKMLGTSFGQLAAALTGTAIAFGFVVAGAAILVGAIWQVGTAVLDGLMATIGGAIGGMLAWWDELSAIWNDGSKGLIEKAWDIGKHLMTGLAEGITALAWAPFDAIANVGTKVADKLASVLGIHSPSRVTMEMGMQVGRGMQLGIDRSTGLVEDASASMGSASVSSMSDRVSFGGPSDARSPMGSFSPTININLSGVSGDAQHVAETVSQAVRREVEAMFRLAALEV